MSGVYWWCKSCRCADAFGEWCPPPREQAAMNRDELRCTGATWSDAVVIFPGEVLAFQNIERQAHALRATAPPRVWYRLPAGTPDLGEDDFEAPPDGVGTPRSREDDFEAPDDGVQTPRRHPRFG
jgi:hypothetical protein